MLGLGVFITGPAAGAVVGRIITVQGSIPAFLGAVNSMRISFPGGVSFSVNAPSGSGFGRGGGSWSWQGQVPTTVLPGQAFTITVSAWGTIVTRTGPEPETDQAQGSASLNLVLENVTPDLSLDPFQSPVVTATGVQPFSLSGKLHEAKIGPYAPKV